MPELLGVIKIFAIKNPLSVRVTFLPLSPFQCLPLSQRNPCQKKRMRSRIISFFQSLFFAPNFWTDFVCHKPRLFDWLLFVRPHAVGTKVFSSHCSGWLFFFRLKAFVYSFFFHFSRPSFPNVIFCACQFIDLWNNQTLFALLLRQKMKCWRWIYNKNCRGIHFRMKRRSKFDD